jgi:3-phytase
MKTATPEKRTQRTPGFLAAAGAALLGLWGVGCQNNGQQGPIDMTPGLGSLSSSVGTPALPNKPFDAAIWTGPSDATKSLVLGTEHAPFMGSVYSYDLGGHSVQTSAQINQPGLIDIKTGFVANGMTYDLAAVAESGTGKIRFYSLDRASGQFTDITGFTAVFKDRSGDAAVPVGVALYRRRSDNAAYVFVSPRSGPITNNLYQYALSFNNGRIDLPNNPVRQFGDINTISNAGANDVQGMVVDDDNGYFYYADRSYAIRKYTADPDAPNANTQLALFGLTEFAGDRNGLAIYEKSDGTGYLLSVDQTPTQSRILLWPREGQATNPNNHVLIGTLNLNADFTDGIEVTSVGLGANYPAGLLVVGNRNGGNFLYYSWQDIASTLHLK